MSDIPGSVRSQVVLRAENRCEYCHLSQEGQEATFHVDHVLPRAAGGKSVLENLALACVSCSLRKWANQTAVDPTTGEQTKLYNPRRDDWPDHFRWQGAEVVPLTAKGRATASGLAINRPIAIAIRKEEMALGRHPPPELS